MKKITQIIITLVLLIPLVAFAALSTSLVSYWKLDGNSNDAVSTNNGTDTSITYNAGNGIITQGAGFSRAGGSKIAIGQTGFPTGATARTVNCWVKPASQPSSQTYTIFQYGSDSSTQLWLFAYAHNGANTILTLDYFGASKDVNQTLSNGTWYMVSAVYTGSAIQMFVNGTQVGGDFSQSLNTGSTRTPSIGRDTGSSGFDGAIDECSIHTRALSSAELTTLYNAGVGCQYSFAACEAAASSFKFWHFFDF